MEIVLILLGSQSLQYQSSFSLTLTNHPLSNMLIACLCISSVRHMCCVIHLTAYFLIDFWSAEEQQIPSLPLTQSEAKYQISYSILFHRILFYPYSYSYSSHILSDLILSYTIHNRSMGNVQNDECWEKTLYSSFEVIHQVKRAQYWTCHSSAELDLKTEKQKRF